MNIERMEEARHHAERAEFLIDQEYREIFLKLTPLEARVMRGLGRQMRLDVAEIRLIVEHMTLTPSRGGMSEKGGDELGGDTDTEA